MAFLPLPSSSVTLTQNCEPKVAEPIIAKTKRARWSEFPAWRTSTLLLRILGASRRQTCRGGLPLGGGAPPARGVTAFSDDKPASNYRRAFFLTERRAFTALLCRTEGFRALERAAAFFVTLRRTNDGFFVVFAAMMVRVRCFRGIERTACKTSSFPDPFAFCARI